MKGLNFEFKNDGNEPYLINGDMKKIHQAIFNVIDNAIRYTDQGSIEINISKDFSNKNIPKYFLPCVRFFRNLLQ